MECGGEQERVGALAVAAVLAGVHGDNEVAAEVNRRPTRTRTWFCKRNCSCETDGESAAK